MKNAFFMVLAALCFTETLHAQPGSIDALLSSVETNNHSLAAYRSFIKSESLGLIAGNKLPDLQTSAYYLPFGENQTGSYFEFEISQQVEFPSVYSARNAWMSEQQKQLEYQFQILRQNTLLETQKLCLEWVYLQKIREITEKRLEQSEQLFQQIQWQFDNGETGILDLNKASIIRLDQQFAIEELTTREKNILQKLQGLNGGQEVNLTGDLYPNPLYLPVTDSLWTARLASDPQLILSQQQTKVAEQELIVEQKKLLPKLSAGVNYQGISGNNYYGFLGGVSIPLWQGRSRVVRAEAQIEYQMLQQANLQHFQKINYETEIERYQLLIQKHDQFQSAMQGLNSTALLQSAFELGEISFMDYYREISFYQEAENRLLEIEFELQVLRAELLKHEL
ncbi:MAG: TolC family protein [Bacteroidetes bacterium]|nr:TolC family protein [Bacteroidota bacterium]